MEVVSNSGKIQTKFISWDICCIRHHIVFSNNLDNVLPWHEQRLQRENSAIDGSNHVHEVDAVESDCERVSISLYGSAGPGGRTFVAARGEQHLTLLGADQHGDISLSIWVSECFTA